MWDPYTRDGDIRAHASKYFGSPDPSKPFESAEMVHPFLLQARTPPVRDDTTELCPHKAKRASLVSPPPGKLEREYTPSPLTAKISQNPLSGIGVGF